jgi:hypothetical protein
VARKVSFMAALGVAMSGTTVVNIHRGEKYDVYIGRGRTQWYMGKSVLSHAEHVG